MKELPPTEVTEVTDATALRLPRWRRFELRALLLSVSVRGDGRCGSDKGDDGDKRCDASTAEVETVRLRALLLSVSLRGHGAATDSGDGGDRRGGASTAEVETVRLRALLLSVSVDADRRRRRR